MVLQHRPSKALRSFDQAMRCLAHPLSLATILILLINDHWLKTSYPSALTGKLSDFAGLFFFPLLLIAFISYFTDNFELPNNWVGRFSFTFTAIMFAAIQISPEFCGHLELVWSTALNTPVSLTPDPTDLIALLVLLPSWHFWHKQSESIALDQPYSRIAVLGLATIATLATSCIGYAEIGRVVIEDGLIYLDGYSYGEGGPYIPVSRDDGKSWDSIAVDDLPVSIATYLDQTPQLPKSVCNPSDPQYCFRITGASRVEYSDDSGQTWDTAWKFPVWRLGYLNRKNTSPCGVGEIQISPLDLALHTDESGGMALFVAMGNQGLVVRSADGSWSSADVPETRPFPTRADNLATAWQDVFYERSLYGLAAITMWFVLHALGWRLVLDKRNKPITSRRLTWWVVRIALLCAIPLLSFLLAIDSLVPNYWLLYLSPAILISGPILTWFFKITPPLSRLTLIVSLLSGLTAALLFIVPVCLSILWALGIIPLHIITVVINLLLYWFTIRFSIRSLRTLILQEMPSPTLGNNPPRG